LLAPCGDKLGVLWYAPVRALYTLAIFLGSALLFLVQPMIAKMILPRFGGAPAVWTASLLFFQASLLLGYLYAHGLSKLKRQVQPFVHILLLGLVAFTLPFAIPAGIGAVGAGNPTLVVLRTLGSAVGLPFLLMSAGAPLLQRWFSFTSDPAAKDPYFLYAASNAGSLVGLLCYPVLVEPNLTLTQQRLLWTFGYVILAVILAGSALLLVKSSLSSSADPSRPTQSKIQDPATPSSSFQFLSWVLLAAVPASLLTGVTNYVTSNIAPIPLLWVVPLALYLITFVAAFARRRRLTSAQFGRWLPLLATPLALVLVLEATQPLVPLVLLHLSVFVLAALMCHTQLVETRPGPEHLTAFYLWISVGGVLGGAFNALLAPVIFKTFAEYPIAIVAAVLLRPMSAPAPGASRSRADLLYPAAVAVLTIGLVLLSRQLGYAGTSAGTMIAIGLPVILAFIAADKPIRFGLSLGSVLLISNLAGTASTGKLAYVDRSFFGVHRVTDDGESYSLTHGTTRHGRQFKDPQRRDTPLTYYSRSGPIGRVFEYLNKHAPPKDVALVGLGVGTLASYGLPGERMTYYEIDPVVDHIAHDARFFTYLRDTKADLKVVLGDARLTLARAAEHSFDLIVLDAFSSDAIPIHLLTREAVAGYLGKLKQGGLLAFHISNNYLDLEPVLGNVAASLSLYAYYDEDEDTSEPGKEASTWVVMSPDPALGKGLSQSWASLESNPKQLLWTDDYSNILGAFK